MAARQAQLGPMQGLAPCLNSWSETPPESGGIEALEKAAGVEQLDDQGLTSHVRQHRRDTGRRLWFLDISSFRTAMVVVAISCEDSGERMAVGFGAGFHMVNAARAAFLELVQSEATMQAHVERAERRWNATASDADCRVSRWKRFADVRNFSFAIGEPAAGLENAGTGNVDDLLDEVEEVCGQRVWFADLSRSEIGIPVAAGDAAETPHLPSPVFRAGPSAACRRPGNFSTNALQAPPIRFGTALARMSARSQCEWQELLLRVHFWERLL